ncbi:hypothetical protein C2S52_000659 [Perilla frutescens var. hirtella]|nr:hypothetical protein C2S52_000659 [Perilla frutescens var. hirtella]
MAPVFGTVQMLKPGKSTFGLELRLIRCYENTNAFSMECIFHDREQPYEIKTFNDIANMQNIGDAAMFEEMIKFLETKPEGPVAVIVQFCRLNMYRGRTVYLFLNDPELADFNIRYLNTGKVRSTSISTLTTSSKRSLNDEIRDGDFELKSISEIMTDEKDEESISINGSEIIEDMVGSSLKASVQSKSCEVKSKTIQQILEDGESGEFRVYATVNSIEDILGISYLACKECLKELDVQDELKFFCEKCQSFDIVGKSRKRYLIYFQLKLKAFAIKKGFFNITVLHEQVNNNKGPFDVVKVVVDDSTVSEKGTSSKSKKGKEIVDENSDQLNIREALMTPKRTNTTNSDVVNIMADDYVKRNLLDEFSATTNKRIKRVVKKEKH